MIGCKLWFYTCENKIRTKTKFENQVLSFAPPFAGKREREEAISEPTINKYINFLQTKSTGKTMIQAQVIIDQKTARIFFAIIEDE